MSDACTVSTTAPSPALFVALRLPVWHSCPGTDTQPDAALTPAFMPGRQRYALTVC